MGINDMYLTQELDETREMLCAVCKMLERPELDGVDGLTKWYRERLIWDYTRANGMEAKEKMVIEAARIGLLIHRKLDGVSWHDTVLEGRSDET